MRGLAGITLLGDSECLVFRCCVRTFVLHCDPQGPNSLLLALWRQAHYLLLHMLPLTAIHRGFVLHSLPWSKQNCQTRTMNVPQMKQALSDMI